MQKRKKWALLLVLYSKQLSMKGGGFTLDTVKLGKSDLTSI